MGVRKWGDVGVMDFRLTNDLLLLCRDFYGLTDEFPSNQLLYRSEQGAKRSLYFVSKAIRQLVNCNEGRVRVSCSLNCWILVGVIYGAMCKYKLHSSVEDIVGTSSSTMILISTWSRLYP